MTQGFSHFCKLRPAGGVVLAGLWLLPGLGWGQESGSAADAPASLPPTTGVLAPATTPSTTLIPATPTAAPAAPAPETLEKAGAIVPVDPLVELARKVTGEQSTVAATEKENDSAAPVAAPAKLTGHDALPLGVGTRAAALPANRGGAAAPRQEGDATSGTIGWMVQTGVALGAVLGLIFLLRAVMARWGGQAGQVRLGTGKAVDVLSRVTIAPKSQVLILRVGHRLLVVNDSPAGMHTLTTIEDPDEIASVLTTISSGKAHSATRQFQQMLEHYNGQYDSPGPGALNTPRRLVDLDDPGEDQDEAQVDRTRDRLSALRAKLRTMNLEQTR